jgi:hypothetical protein
MTERDAAWMTRIVAEFSDQRLAALVKVGRLRDPSLERELVRILRGRRDRILARYLSRVSPLSHPVVVERDAGAELCLRDLAMSSHVVRPRRHSAVVWSRDGSAPAAVSERPDGRVCAVLPRPAARPELPAYLVADVMIRGPGAPGAARIHLYYFGKSEYRIVGLERPDAGEPPDAGALFARN